MAILIESLEGRSLFAAGGLVGSLLDKAALLSDPAVQATVALVRDDVVVLEAARQELAGDVADAKLLKDTIRAGVELIAADRTALREAKGDPTALAAAKTKLDADRQQIRDDLATARHELKSNLAISRNALASVTSGLRDHLKQLRVQLRNASFSPTPTQSSSSLQSAPQPSLSFEPASAPTPTPADPTVPPSPTIEQTEPTPAEGEQPATTIAPTPTPPIPVAPVPVPEPTPAPEPVSPPRPRVAPNPVDADVVAPTPPASSSNAEANEGMAEEIPGWLQKPPLLMANSIHPSAEKIAATFEVAVGVLQKFGITPVDEALVQSVIDDFLASVQDRRMDPTEEAQFKSNLSDLVESVGLPGQPGEPRRQLGGVIWTLLLSFDPIVGTNPLPY